MLIIEPRNGLANRLRVIDSGIELAKKLNTPLEVDWVMNKDLNCRFDTLFEPIEGVIIKDGIKLKFPFNRSLKLHFFYKSINKDISFNTTALKAKLGGGTGKISYEQFSDSIKKFNKIFICTGEFFFESPGHYHLFHPKQEILDKVITMCNELGKDFIGIHLRRTDNKKAISYSPTSLFIKTMKSLLDANDKTRFFLSTDSPEDEMLLKEIFKGSIWSFPKILDRNNEAAIKAALMDLLCLSKASTIYGSYYSSFSEAASYFSGNKLITLKNSQ